MKKLIVSSFVLMAVVVACTKKAVPTTGTTPEKTAIAKTEPAKTEEEIKADIEAKAKAETAQKTTVATRGLDGDLDNGKNVFTTKCTSCHAAKNPGDYTFFRWENILRSMVPKAKLSAEEEKQVTAYIKANAKQ